MEACDVTDEARSLQSNNDASRYRWDVYVKLWVVFLKQQIFMYLQLPIVIINDLDFVKTNPNA